MQMGAEIRQSVADVDTDSLLSQNWPPSPSIRWRSCSETESATTDRNGRKNGKKRTGRYGIPNFRRFRKSLATSTWTTVRWPSAHIAHCSMLQIDHLPHHLACRTHPSHARSEVCRPPLRVASQSPLSKDCAPRLRNQMLCPYTAVRTSKIDTRRRCTTPNEKITNHTNQPNITHYIAGVGPLNNN